MVVYIAAAMKAITLAVLAICLRTGLALDEKRASKPNVLVFMSDDQDHVLDSLSVQPNVTGLIGGKGVTYEKHYCTVAWCCPSRVNFFTGRTAHNTNLTSAQPPYGGWPRFGELGLNDDYLPVWLSDAGVNTYYVGKFMNGYAKGDLAAVAGPPKGWTDSSLLVEPWTYNYLNSHYTSNNHATSEADIESFQGTHTTTVTWDKALAFLDDAASKGGQFYMQVAPVAPHLQIGGDSSLPVIPPGYEGVFNDRTVPRTSNWNPDQPSGASWVKQLPQLSGSQISLLDEIYFHRLANLAFIDDMVGSIIQKLEQKGLLNNTYIIYTTDNGFHMGNHRLQAGKRCPYEEDINIPLLIRGPDVAQGVTSEIVNSHTDMAPTILQMLGLPLREEFDGAPIAYTSSDLGISNKTELVNVEFWNSGTATPEGLTPGTYGNNTYKALRLLSGDYSLLYTVWCTGEHEFYNMKNDPGQMTNRLADPPQGIGQTYYGRSEDDLFDRLNALLMVTKACAQDSCREPWRSLFPSGEVSDLPSALDKTYDAFFASQPKISFSGCIQNHIIEDEGPQEVTNYNTWKKHHKGSSK